MTYSTVRLAKATEETPRGLRGRRRLPAADRQQSAVVGSGEPRTDGEGSSPPSGPARAADLAFLTRLHSSVWRGVPCPRSQCRSRTEEVRGSNPLTSTPNLAGQSVASLKRATLAACCGRAAAANSSRSPAEKALRHRTTRFQASTMTAESSRTLTPTDADPPAHPAPAWSPCGRPDYFSTTSHDDGQSKSTPRWSSTASAGFERELPLGQPPKPVVDTAGRRRGPYPSGCQPIAAPQNLTRFGHSGRGNARIPDTHTGLGHPDRQTPTGHWTPSHGHRTRGTRRSHRTLDAGRAESG
jgi:hypothetical protein